MKYYCALGHERFQPDALLKQAAAAELAGFHDVYYSDHLAPRWTAETAPTVLMNVSAADPEGALRLYGDKVLSNLKCG